MFGVLLKGGALLAFFAIIGGATLAVQSYLGDDSAARVLQVDAERSTLNVTAGHDVTYALDLQNRGDTAERASARVTGEGIDARSPEVIVPARGSTTVFVTIRVPADNASSAPNVTRSLTVRIENAAGESLRAREGLLTLRVLPASAVSFQDGDSGTVLYTGRLTRTGEVFSTNDPLLKDAKFPRTALYSPFDQPLPVASRPQPSVVTGFFEGLLGMQPGESRTVSFPAEKGYGAATTTVELPREEIIERDYQLVLRTETVARATFDDYVERTKQGNATDFDAGDVFRFEQGPNRWPYRITAIDDEKVDYTLQVEAGQKFTLYPFWVDASVVVRANDTEVEFRTTPTGEIDEPMTVRNYWPDMSAIASVNETSIVLRHSPTVGFKFTQPATQSEPEQAMTVVELRDDAILASVATDNPLAGEALTFDIQLLDIKR